MTRAFDTAFFTALAFLALVISGCMKQDEPSKEMARLEAKEELKSAPVAAPAPGKDDLARQEDAARKWAEEERSASQAKMAKSAVEESARREEAARKSAAERRTDGAGVGDAAIEKKSAPMAKAPKPAAVMKPAPDGEPRTPATRPAPEAAGAPVAAPPPTAAAPSDSAVDEQVKRIDDYLKSLRIAAYTFNPPSPITVAKPVTVHFWLDPSTTAAQLAEELRKTVPRDAERIESGQTKWSPRMRAVLSGPDFDIKPVPGSPEEQPVSATSRTTWSWDVTPLRPGDNQILHLRLQVVLPPEIGGPKTITTLDREIRVEVTLWWLFDTFFEKYWKWLLGGLGTALSAVIAWWWKNRRGGPAAGRRRSRG